MRDPLEILLWAVLAYMAGGVLSLLLSRNERAAITINGLFGALGGALGLYAVLPKRLNGLILLMKKSLSRSAERNPC